MNTPNMTPKVHGLAWKKNWLAIMLSFWVLGLAACGGSSTPETTQNIDNPTQSTECDVSEADDADCGSVFIALTDAEGDFMSYTVDVQSLTLERQDGSVIETLPQSTRIDFAQYADLTEFFTAAQVPPGVYVAGSITLDYSNAQIVVEANGEPVDGLVVDAETGDQLGVTTLKIQLDDQRRLVVARGIPSLLTIDFDLNASHMVDTSVTPAIAEAEPFLLAEIDPVDSKQVRLRGALRAVDVDAGTYTLAVRPYHRRTGDFGRVTVNTTEETSFEVDGVPYVGSEGLRALEATGQGTLVVSTGNLNVAERQYTAEYVLAGSSVPGFDSDGIVGNVIAREGNSLKVRGAVVVPSQGEVYFNTDVTVEMDEDTSIIKLGDRDMTLGLDAVSVGQRIMASGDLSAATDGGPRTLDARRVRMVVTHLNGTINSTTVGQKNVTVQSFDRRRVGLFNFTGTGMTSEQDADPDDYEVATGNLTLADIQPGSPVRVYGFVTPFGSAPADFEGRTVVDFSDARSALGINWDGGTAAPFLSIGEEGIVLDLANEFIGRAHYIRQGSVFLDLFDLPASPTIVAANDRPNTFAIKQGDTISIHNDFTNFVSDLSSRLDGATVITRMHAAGGYAADSNIFNAHRIAVNLD